MQYKYNFVRIHLHIVVVAGYHPYNVLSTTMHKLPSVILSDMCCQVHTCSSNGQHFYVPSSTPHES